MRIVLKKGKGKGRYIINICGEWGLTGGRGGKGEKGWYMSTD